MTRLVSILLLLSCNKTFAQDIDTSFVIKTKISELKIVCKKSNHNGSTQSMLLLNATIKINQTVNAWFAVGIGNLNDCDFTLGLENFSARDLFIYPNPTSNSLNIELPVLTNKKNQIFDISGKLVQEFETDKLITQTDIFPLQNGVFTIRIDFNGEFVNKRFIVQK